MALVGSPCFRSLPGTGVRVHLGGHECPEYCHNTYIQSLPVAIYHFRLACAMLSLIACKCMCPRLVAVAAHSPVTLTVAWPPVASRFGSEMGVYLPGAWKGSAFPLNSSPMIRPNSPSTDEKISITSTLTNLSLVSIHTSVLDYSAFHSQARIRSI